MKENGDCVMNSVFLAQATGEFTGIKNTGVGTVRIHMGLTLDTWQFRSLAISFKVEESSVQTQDP